MDLSHLTRPSILCQCSRCSSSVAACENEWAKLSDTYSTVTGWLSIDMNRINVSADKKQIPQSSELEFVRGRVVQDIQCRLCHKKLGGLVHLETETKVFWKLPKVSFREIISMRESHPLFVEGSLSWLLAPVEETVSPTAITGNTSLSANRSESMLNNTLLKQGASLSKISNSVEELHDTMSDLKQSFKALRLELNTTPSTRSQDYHGDEAMEMLRTVLKDLQSKSDEIEKLKLENESLKLKNKCLIQGRQISGGLPITPNLLGGGGGDRAGIPEVQSPGFLTERGKRDLLVTATQAPIADSFDEEIMDDTEAAPLSIAPVKVPLKPAADEAPTSPLQSQHERADLGSPFGSRSRRDSREPATKRMRLTMTEDQEIHSVDTGITTSPPAKNKKRGRRPSQQKSQPEEPRTPSTGGALSYTNAADETTRTKETQPTRPQKRRGRGRSKTSAASRSTSQAAAATSSRGSSRVTRKATKSQEEATAPASKLQEKLSLQNEILPGVIRSAGFEVAVKNVAELTPESVVNENDLFPPQKTDDRDDQRQRELDAENEKRRQAKIAARDLVAKAAMEREEAMDDG